MPLLPLSAPIASLCPYCLSLPPYIACLSLPPYIAAFNCLPLLLLPSSAHIACLCIPTLLVFPCLPTLLHSTASLCSYCLSLPPYTLLVFTYIATFNYLPLLLLPFPASLHCLSSPAFLSLSTIYPVFPALLDWNVTCWITSKFLLFYLTFSFS